ncbi:MAG: hypothetical protein IJ458_01955 [Clostridia bacterium]|nr:hypothetical protein [Clostridia bacterium]
MFERFVTNKDGYTNIFDIATTGRLDKWLIYLTPWIKHFYSIPFGLGLGFNYNTPYSSHSFYIGYISKIGIVGFILLSIFIYLIVFHKNKSNLKFKYLPILIMFLICLVEDVSHNTFNFIPFIISIITLKYNNQTQQ